MISMLDSQSTCQWFDYNKTFTHWLVKFFVLQPDNQIDELEINMGTSSNDQITVFDVIEGEMLKTVRCQNKIQEYCLKRHLSDKLSGQISHKIQVFCFRPVHIKSH